MKMMKKYRENIITIYTPTFNRAYCLPQLYNSLLRQTYQNFEWLIIDDGSTDNTKSLIINWISTAPFIIRYFKQENEGKMAKLNFAHKIIDTELCMCMDSDDYLTDNAIEVIFLEWNKIKFNSKLGGIVGLDILKNGKIVGTKFPENLNIIKFGYFNKLGIKGDKKFIYKTNVINKFPPYPSFSGEKFPAPGYLYRLIDIDYDLWIINRPLCIVEYLEDGLSKNKYKQFKSAANSFIFYRHEMMRLAINYSERFRNAIHYVSSCIFAKKNFFLKNNYPITTFIAIPFGIILNLYISKTDKKGLT